jgi:hypothetical protein
MANTKRNSMDKKKRTASAPARRSAGRKGGFFMDTAADMVLPQGLNAGLATLGLVGLNDYMVKPRRGRKQRGGENENSGNENSGMFANMFGNNNAPANNAPANNAPANNATGANNHTELVQGLRDLCARLPANNSNKKNNNKKNNNVMMNEVEVAENEVMVNNANANAMEGGRRNKKSSRCRQCGGALAGASLDAAFGGQAGLDDATLSGSAYAGAASKANLLNLGGELGAGAGAEGKVGLEGGKRKKATKRGRKQRGGALAGASLDAAFGGQAGLDDATLSGSTYAGVESKANLLNLAGELGAGAEGKVGLEGGKRKKATKRGRKQRGGADEVALLECPDGGKPIVSMMAKGDLSAAARAALGATGAEAGAEAGLAGEVGAQAGPIEAGVTGEAGAEMGAEAGMTGGRRRRNANRKGGFMTQAAMDLLFPAGLTAGATTYGLLLADEVSKRGAVKKATKAVKKTAAKAKKTVSRRK